MQNVAGARKLLLPFKDPDQPIDFHELADFRRQAQRQPTERDGWELEREDGGLKIHRVAQIADENGKTVENIRCELEMECGPVSALLFFKDPKRRLMWDDLLGPSMKLLNSKNHEFVRMHFDGFFGLAAKSFLFWCAVQGYDKNGTEREGGDAATAWVMLWRAADIAWPNLPSVDDTYDKNCAFGFLAEEIAFGKTRLTICVRIKYGSTMLIRNIIPRVVSYSASEYSSRLLTAAASQPWDDDEIDLLDPYNNRGAIEVKLDPFSPVRSEVEPSSPVRYPLSPARLVASPSRGLGRNAGAPKSVPGIETTGVDLMGENSWSPQRGMPRPVDQDDLRVTTVELLLEDVPAYQLRYERSRKRDPPPLEPLEHRLKGVLSDWRKNLDINVRTQPLVIAPAEPFAPGADGTRGSDAWLNSLIDSMAEVRIVSAPWAKQDEPQVSRRPSGTDVWDRMEKAGLGERPLSAPVDVGADVNAVYDQASTERTKVEKQRGARARASLVGIPSGDEGTVQEGDGGWAAIFGNLLGGEVQPEAEVLKDATKVAGQSGDDGVAQEDDGGWAALFGNMLGGEVEPEAEVLEDATRSPRRRWRGGARGGGLRTSDLDSY